MYSKTIRMSAGYTTNIHSGKKVQNRKQITVHGRTKAELDKNIALAKIQYREEQKGILSHNTMNGIIDWYFCTNKLKPKTLASNISYITTIRQIFGKKDPAKISSQELLFFFNDLKKQGCTLHVVHTYFKTLNKLFNKAVTEGHILRNPLTSLNKTEYAKQPRPKPQYNIIDTVKRILQLTFSEEDPLFSLNFKVMLLLTCDGCLRNAELYGLRWDDIDFDKKLLSVRQISYPLTKKQSQILQLPQQIISTPKSEDSIRTVSLSEITVKLLQEFKSQCDAYLAEHSYSNPNHILFFQRIGKQKKKPSQRTVKGAYGTGFRIKLSRICESYNLPAKISPHKIRKAAITLRDDLGISYRICEYILGHSPGKLNSAYYIETERAVCATHKIWEKCLNQIIFEHP